MAPREPLSRDRILDAALDIAATEGIEGLSMRRIAKALGVEAMSLYNHVSNKTDILDGIAERVLGSIDPVDPALPWAERVRASALSAYRAMSRHPVVPLALASDLANPTSPTALKTLDDVAGALFEAGFGPDEVRQALSAVNSLVFGSIMLASTAFARPARDPGSGPAVQHGSVEVYVRQVDHTELPNFHRLLHTVSAADPEEDFQKALDFLVSGLTAEHARGKRKKGA
jgi:TetR/AcrR family tetracycline transcriptional repressor